MMSHEGAPTRARWLWKLPCKSRDNGVDVVEESFQEVWLVLRICPVSAVNRQAYGYSHNARWWRYVRATVARFVGVPAAKGVEVS